MISEEALRAIALAWTAGAGLSLIATSAKHAYEQAAGRTWPKSLYGDMGFVALMCVLWPAVLVAGAGYGVARLWLTPFERAGRRLREREEAKRLTVDELAERLEEERHG